MIVWRCGHFARKSQQCWKQPDPVLVSPIISNSNQTLTPDVPQSEISVNFRSGGSPGTPPMPDAALEAIGPVLEGVLSSLTQEYEKRLLAKDHEVKAAQHEIKARL